jgi:uncharacterized YkwD family protein
MTCRKNTIYTILGIFTFASILAAGCNQNYGALPNESPPSFQAWENGNGQSKIQTQNVNTNRIYYRSSWVLRAEKMLQSLGYKDKADYNYDDTTRKAVSTFQEDQKLQTTGWMDQKTYDRLKSVYNQAVQQKKGTAALTEPSTPKSTTPTPTPSPNTRINVGSAEENRIIELTNAERQRNGLAPLKVNSDLMKQAKIKAQDMVTKNYFSHTSPTLGSPFDQIRNAEIPYTHAGENIAGNRSVYGAFQSWMGSSGHRANILNANFNQIGVGVVDGIPYGKIFVQMFIRQ